MAISGNQKAPLYALSGVMRSGTSRSNAIPGGVFITVGGVAVGWDRAPGAPGVIIDSLSITEVLDETPNTCRFRINGMVPAIGSDVIIRLGSRNNLDRLFAGFALTVSQVYAADNPKHVQADVTCVDYHWLLSFKVVTAWYRSLYASDILADLVAKAGAVNGILYSGQPVLPIIDEITFTNEPLGDCITRLMRRVGGYWYCDYDKIIRAFIIDDESRADVTPLTPTHPSLAHFSHDVEQTQALTRVYVEGRGSTVLTTVNAGEAAIPLEAVDMFETGTDVLAKVSFQGSAGGALLIGFAGVERGGSGSLVGPGIGPADAPTVTAVLGTGLEPGTHDYAVTFVTASGESLPSPVASTQTGALTVPTVAPSWLSENLTTAVEPRSDKYYPGEAISYQYSYSADASVTMGGGGPGETPPSPPSAPHVASTAMWWYYTPGDSAAAQAVRGPAATDPRINYIYVYRSRNGTAGPFYWLKAFTGRGSGGGSGEWLLSQDFDPVVTGATPTGGAVNSSRVQLSDIPVGGVGVTARKIYRTAANQSQLQLLTTLADNTTTSHLDSASDTTLGANLSMTDTSGLPQPAGQVLPGSTVLPVASAAGFLPGGGWAPIGNGEQVIRYQSISGNTLTGIPATGLGSIWAAVSYNSTVTAASMITGIPTSGPGSLTRGVVRGDEVYSVVMVDNWQGQSQLAAAVNVGDGIREEWVQDRRLSITEARARGFATLNLRTLGQRAISYTSRDINTAAGKLVSVNLTAPTNVSGTFRIQQVTIGNFRPHLNQMPTYTVQASSSLFTFEDWLRRQESSF